MFYPILSRCQSSAGQGRLRKVQVQLYWRVHKLIYYKQVGSCFLQKWAQKKFCAKKVVSDSRGPVDIAVGLVNSVLNCVTSKWSFLGTVHVIQISEERENCYQSCSSNFFFRLVKMMLGLVYANYSLPDWKAVKLTFFAACPIPQNQVSQKY